MNDYSQGDWIKALADNIKPQEPDTDTIARHLKNLRKAVKGIGWLDVEDCRDALELVVSELRNLADDIHAQIQTVKDWEERHTHANGNDVHRTE